MLSVNEKKDVKVEDQTTTSILPQNLEESSISASHLEEFHKSAIDDEIAKLNFKTLDSGEESFEYLIYDLEDKDYRNNGVLRTGKLKQYEHLWHGGWWCKSLDPETGDERLFGQFKPNKPRKNAQGKIIKYENPPKSKSQAFFLEPSRKAWEAIAKRYKKKVPNEPTHQFWQWVKAENIPIILTEGAKKAASLLKAGYAAIALVGVWNGCKKLTVPEGFPNAHKEEKDGIFQYFVPKLIPDLELFATEGRTFFIAFDHDEKPQTKANVTHAIERTAKLLEECNCTVKISQWNSSLGKGADDILYNYGAEIFNEFIVKAKSIQQLKSNYFKEKKDKEIKQKLKAKPQTVKTVPYNKMNYVEKGYTDLFEGDHWITIDGAMHLWNGKYYEPVPEVEIRRNIVNWLKEYEEPLYIHGKLTDRVIRYTKPEHITKILQWAKEETGKDSELINPKGFLNLANGVLKIEWDDNDKLKQELIPHTPEQYYTYCSDAKYDPNAETEDCDRLLAALEPEQQDIFLKLVAASFDLETLRGKIGRIPAALCIGRGKNGKDSLRETVRLLFGNQGIGSYSFSDFKQYDRGTKFEIASLINNVRISWSPENTPFLSLDNLISLRKAISGETMISRSLHKEGKPFDCKSVFFFNVNELPMIQGDMTAIQSRYCILEFNKTYTKNPTKRGEIKEDPRFKDDKNFIKNNILSAFLNRVLEALARLPDEGIDTNATDTAFENARRENNHLLTFCEDMGLVEQDEAQTLIKEIWDKLLWWYQHENGVLSYVGERKVWEDQVHPYDKNIKAPNQIFHRLHKIFPQTERKHGRDGNYISGISFNAQNARLSFTSSHEEEGNSEQTRDTSCEAVGKDWFTTASREPNRASPCEEEKDDVNECEAIEAIVEEAHNLTQQGIQARCEAVKAKSEETEDLEIQLAEYMNSCQSLDDYNEMAKLPFFSKELLAQAWERLSVEKRSQIQQWSEEKTIALAVEDLAKCQTLEEYLEISTVKYKPHVYSAAWLRLPTEEQERLDRLRQPVPELENCTTFKVGDRVCYLKQTDWGIGEVTGITSDNIEAIFPAYYPNAMNFNPQTLTQEGDRVIYQGSEGLAYVWVKSLEGDKPKVQTEDWLSAIVVNLEELRL